MDILTQLKKQSEQVEVLELQSEKTTVEFEANKLKSCTISQTNGTAARVIRKGKLGFSATTDAGALDKLAVNTLESAAYGDEVHFSFADSKPAKIIRTFDKTISELPVERLVEMGKEILDLILPIDPDVRCNVGIERETNSARIRNHKGLDVSFNSTPLSLGFEIDRVEGDDILIVYDQQGTTIWESDYLAFAKKLVEKLQKARRIVPIKPGKMPVLFAPSGMLALCLPIHQGVNGKNVYKGISPVKDKIGEKIFDEKITILDDGTLDGKFASAAYDDEGVPHQKNFLIDKGVLKGFIYDLKTASQQKVETTGNASRGLFYPPEPSFTNFVLSPGMESLQDIISRMDEGILVEDLLGIGQGNTISGAFSDPLALAFKIEKGEIIGRVKDASIAGNIYDLLKNVEAVSQETQWVYNSFCLPYMLIPEMNVMVKQ